MKDTSLKYSALNLRHLLEAFANPPEPKPYLFYCSEKTKNELDKLLQAEAVKQLNKK